MNPKIVGIIKLDIAYQRRESVTVVERVTTVGFDTDGQAWGLVSRLTNIEENMARLSYVRWIRFDAIPFAADEFVSKSGWSKPAGAP